MKSQIMLQSNLPASFSRPRRGKVRDIFELGDALLIVTTDRISAFDVVMRQGIPGKGEVLNRISALWLRRLGRIIPNHLVSCDLNNYPSVCSQYANELAGRSMLVRKTKPLPVECVVRGYLSGSAWKLYRAGQDICGVLLPRGLRESDILSEPIFTPTTKAQAGHDENITFEQVAGLVSYPTAEAIRKASLKLYEQAQKLAEPAGIIIADTKFEFGLIGDEVILIDEVLTPDSSRFWPIDGYKPGGPQPSFDKQFLRDWLEASGWNKNPPPPDLPDEVVEKTAEKYREAIDRLRKVLAN